MTVGVLTSVMWDRVFVALFGGPGGDLLSRALRRSTIGAEGFHGRVRDGIGCLLPRHGHQVVETGLLGLDDVGVFLFCAGFRCRISDVRCQMPEHQLSSVLCHLSSDF